MSEVNQTTEEMLESIGAVNGSKLKFVGYTPRGLRAHTHWKFEEYDTITVRPDLFSAGLGIFVTGGDVAGQRPDNEFGENVMTPWENFGFIFEVIE